MLQSLKVFLLFEISRCRLFSQGLSSNAMSMQQPQGSSSDMMQLMSMMMPMLMQRRQQSTTQVAIGQSAQQPAMDAVRAALILKKHFDGVDTAAGDGPRRGLFKEHGEKADGLVSMSDLKAAAEDKNCPDELREALYFFGTHAKAYEKLETSEGDGEVDGLASISDIDEFVRHYA